MTQDIADSLGLKKAEGALVAEPQANSPAQKAGIEAGDIITAVDGKEIKDARDLAKRIGALAPKTSVKLTVMGKMGAFELNYSSDIDLIVLYDLAASGLSADAEPSTLFVRITQRLVKLLQERTADGYVFRTDLRLRPDPASTAIAISTEAAISYYESVGQNWERAAMLAATVFWTRFFCSVMSTAIPIR